MEEQIINEIKSFPAGFLFTFAGLLSKYNIEEKDMAEMQEKILSKIGHEVTIQEKNSVSYYTLMRKKAKDEDIYLRNKSHFDKLHYDFYFYHSWKFGKVKVSKNHFAILTRNPTKLFIIDDKEKAKELFKEFLAFVKSADKERPLLHGEKTGIVSEYKWAFKPQYWFKKKPNSSKTIDFFKKVFAENGFKFDEPNNQP